MNDILNEMQYIGEVNLVPRESAYNERIRVNLNFCLVNFGGGGKSAAEIVSYLDFFKMAAIHYF